MHCTVTQFFEGRCGFLFSWAQCFVLYGFQSRRVHNPFLTKKDFGIVCLYFWSMFRTWVM